MSDRLAVAGERAGVARGKPRQPTASSTLPATCVVRAAAGLVRGSEAPENPCAYESPARGHALASARDAVVNGLQSHARDTNEDVRLSKEVRQAWIAPRQQKS